MTYECDFELPPQTQPGDAHDKTVFIPWSSFNATYRGRPKKDAKPINLKKIKRFSIMMRRSVSQSHKPEHHQCLCDMRYADQVLTFNSFFGTQEGDFSLKIRSICALVDVPKHASLYAAQQDTSALEKGHGGEQSASHGRIASIVSNL